MGLIESPLLELCHLFILHIVTPVLYTCDVIWVVRLDILDNIIGRKRLTNYVYFLMSSHV